MAKQITNICSKEAIAIQPTDMLICCYCEREYSFKDGYDESFCCEDCCINQEEENIREGRVEDICEEEG